MSLVSRSIICGFTHLTRIQTVSVESHFNDTSDAVTLLQYRAPDGKIDSAPIISLTSKYVPSASSDIAVGWLCLSFHLYVATIITS